jgi:putative addiction module component (TIGR02574 family)
MSVQLSLDDVSLDAVRSMTVADRLELIGKIWDTIGPDDDVPLTDWQKKLLDERMEQHRKNPDDVYTAEEFRERLRRRR